MMAVNEMKKANVDTAKDISNSMPSRSVNAHPNNTMAMPGGVLVNGPGMRMINASIRQKNAVSRIKKTWLKKVQRGFAKSVSLLSHFSDLRMFKLIVSASNFF